MIEVNITMTGKGYHPSSEWQQFGHDRRIFANLAEFDEWLDQTYGKSKRAPMYVDTKDGKTIRCGYVIGFRNADWSHYPVDKWIQQDWLHISESKTVDLDEL